MSNFDLTNLAVQMICPNNLVKTDVFDLPSVLVYIPAFKNSDVLVNGDDNLHPAFIVNGEQIPGFYYSKYQNVMNDGVAYSLPGKLPRIYYGFDTATAACEAKGAGWHLSTAAEWAAIALWCKKNGFLPHGNNDNGKDINETIYKAIPKNRNLAGDTTYVATGTGPLEWSHDKTMAGIWDMNGNASEILGGVRLVWGELQILANNDAADSNNPQTEKSACWKAINAADGSLVEPEDWPDSAELKSSGNTVRIDHRFSTWYYSTNIENFTTANRGTRFGELTCDDTISAAAKAVLRALALLPDEDDTANQQGVTMNNSCGLMYITRGGLYNDNTNAGLNEIRLVDGFGTENFCFRCSYIPELDT